jgi:MFS transporter, ACS family, hexuronate transporter
LTEDQVDSIDTEARSPFVAEEGLRRKAGSSNYRWLIVALGFAVIIVNYMDRTAISYAVGPLKQEFGLSNTSFGLIGAAFSIGYTIMTLGGGIIVDLWGARKVWAGAALAWSVCTGFLAACTGFVHLFALRVMLGITEGPCFPAMQRTVTDWLPINERARASAVCLAAVSLASVVGAPLISQLIVNLGWRAMFVVLATLGIIWSVVWWWAFRDYPQNSRHVSEAELKHICEGQLPTCQASDEEIRRKSLAEGKTTWKFILSNPSLSSNNYAFFSFGYLLFFATIWLPNFFEEAYHLKLKEVGIFLIAPWLTAAVFVMIMGVLSDWLYKRTKNIRKSRTHIIWVCQMLSALCFLFVPYTPSLPVVIILVSLGLGLGMAPNAQFYALNADLAKDRAATSLGLMDCYLALAGVLAPAITGLMRDLTHNFNSAIFLMAGFSFTSSIIVFLLQHPDRDLEKMQNST